MHIALALVAGLQLQVVAAVSASIVRAQANEAILTGSGTVQLSSVRATRHAYPAVSKVLSLDGSGGGATTETINGTVSGLTAGVTYRSRVEILRDDLGGHDEYVTSIVIDGRKAGECHPNGHDHDCTFYDCKKTGDFTPSSDTVNVEVTLTGHSKKCDCNKAHEDFLCYRADTGPTNVELTSTRAAARITFEPSPDQLIKKAFILPDDGGAGEKTFTMEVAVMPNTQYSAVVEVLRDGLGDQLWFTRYVKDITLDLGTPLQLGTCKPDGGDHDCTFFTCNNLATTTFNSGSQNTAKFSFTLTGNSKKCDCNELTFECSKEGTHQDPKDPRTPARAAARVTLEPLPGR